MPWRAAIFDIDGTLLDNMPFHVQAFDTFLGRHGLPPLTAEDRHRNDGKRNSDIFPQLFDPPRPAEDILRMIDEKESLYRELSRGRLRPLPGLLRLLDALAARGVPVAAAPRPPPRTSPTTCASWA